MKLSEAMALTLYLMHGETTTQLNWNLETVIADMLLSIFDVDYYYEKGIPLVTKFEKTMGILEDREYIARSNIVLDEAEKLLNDVVFGSAKSYHLTDDGIEYVHDIAYEYRIDLDDKVIANFVHPLYVHDTAFLLSIIKENKE